MDVFCKARAGVNKVGSALDGHGGKTDGTAKLPGGRGSGGVVGAMGDLLGDGRGAAIGTASGVCANGHAADGLPVDQWRGVGGVRGKSSIQKGVLIRREGQGWIQGLRAGF